MFMPYEMDNNDCIALVLSLLQKANSTSNPTDLEDILREVCSVIKDFDERDRSVLISSKFQEQLNQLISIFGIIPEFSDRDFTSYDRNDFKDYDVCAHALLKCAITYISLIKSQQHIDDIECTTRQNLSAPHSTSTLTLSSHSEGFTVNDEQHSADETSHITSPKLTKSISNILPNIMLLIGGNIRNPVWSSEDCHSLSIQLLKCVKDLFGCLSIHEICLVNSVSYHEHNSIPNSKLKSVLVYLFNILEVPLSRDRWEKNPFLCEVFNWLIPNIKSPNLSDHINQIMATCLNFVHSHEIPNKLNGLLSLKHLIENVSGEELRWYNRADVIYDTLKHQMYSKEELVLDSVLQCSFLILRVLERNPMENAEKHHEIMSNILRDTEMENLIIMRRVWISNLAKFILDCGILCIQHLSMILRVIETFLEIDDSPLETARIEALQALENVIVVAWPRMRHHSENALQFLLKLMINITMESSDLRRGIRGQLVSKTVCCVKLLLKINPNIRSDLEEVNQSGKLMMLKNFVDSVLLDTATGIEMV